MRFLVGLSMTVIAACSGASSSELFGEAPRVVTEEPSSTEPGAQEEAPLPPSERARDAGVEPSDAGTQADAKPDAQPDVVDASLPAKCTFDSDCPIDGEVCNWQTDTCAAPGAIGAPCKRDLECSADLCNWKLTKCSDPAPAGTPCRRHKECASGTCSSTSSLCK